MIQTNSKKCISSSIRQKTWLCREVDDHAVSRQSQELVVQKRHTQRAPSGRATSTGWSTVSQTLELATTDLHLNHLPSKIHTFYDSVMDIQIIKRWYVMATKSVTLSVSHFFDCGKN